MAQRSFAIRAFLLRTLSSVLGVQMRGYDAGRWGRFSREARMGRTSTETMHAAPQVRNRARYFVANDGHAAAAVAALVTYAVGAGPMPANANQGLVDSFVNDWWGICDADGRTDFGGLIALMVRALVTDGECFAVFVNTPDGLRLRLYPAEQIDESLTRDLGGGAFIAAGIEFNARGERVAYHIQPFAPTQSFDTYAPPIRVDAADVLHLMRPVGVGQVRGVSWLAPIMLKLHDLGLLNDALLKGFQVAAAHAGFLTDTGGPSSLPFDGERDGDALDVSLEPGVVRRLPPGMDIKFNQPNAAQQSIEFRTSIVEEISAALGVPAFMVSGNVNRANYSSLRAALITFKAALEALQFSVLVPQVLAPIWRRFAITEGLRNGADVSEADLNCEWRFPAMPEADPIKQIQATVAALNAKLMSRREAIAARGETIERVDADIAADPHAQTEQETEDSNANG
jgi:lambda family phage portal protein